LTAIRGLVSRIKLLKDPWQVDQTGAGVPTAEVQTGQGSTWELHRKVTQDDNAAFRLHEDVATLVADLSARPQIRAAIDAITAHQAIDQWADCLSEAFFKAAKSANPGIWETRQHAVEFFRLALPVFILTSGSSDIPDRAKEALGAEATKYFARVVLKQEVTDRSEPFRKVFDWMFDLAQADCAAMLTPDVHMALLANWASRNRGKRDVAS
jgi:hypothetical protein